MEEKETIQLSGNFDKGLIEQITKITNEINDLATTLRDLENFKCHLSNANGLDLKIEQEVPGGTNSVHLSSILGRTVTSNEDDDECNVPRVNKFIMVHFKEVESRKIEELIAMYDISLQLKKQDLKDIVEQLTVKLE